MDIRPLRSGEGSRFRRLRLDAIADAPDAFYWSLDTEFGLSADYWDTWADSPEKIMFVAEDAGSWLGTAGCSLRADGSGTLDATGMWVAPSARGRRIGERLIEKIVAWGRDRGAGRMEFAVTESNDHALTLYRKLGFEPTGKRRPLESNPALTGLFMSRPL